MSGSPVEVQFSDGVKLYAWYSNTVDILNPELFEKLPDRRSAPRRDPCSCQQPSEDVILTLDAGKPLRGKACRKCMVVTEESLSIRDF